MPRGLSLADFLGNMITRAIAAPRGGLAYCQGRLSTRICLDGSAPTPFNGLFRQPAALPLFRLHVAPRGSTGILTGSAIGIALRLSLRTRLTLIRLALIRKPWSCGEGVSRPLCRYLYLHLLFHTLQEASRPPFDAGGMLPYRPKKGPKASAGRLCPIIIHAGFLD